MKYVLILSYAVKISGAKNIKFYGREEMEILNPCHVSSVS